jgi:hypothetical protein
MGLLAPPTTLTSHAHFLVQSGLRSTHFIPAQVLPSPPSFISMTRLYIELICWGHPMLPRPMHTTFAKRISCVAPRARRRHGSALVLTTMSTTKAATPLGLVR